MSSRPKTNISKACIVDESDDFIHLGKIVGRRVCIENNEEKTKSKLEQSKEQQTKTNIVRACIVNESDGSSHLDTIVQPRVRKKNDSALYLHEEK